MDILYDCLYEVVDGLLRRPGIVRREQQPVRVFYFEQGIVGRYRFLREYIHHGPAEDAAVECIGERLFVDDAAAGDVDEDGRWFPATKFRLADKSSCQFVKR